MVKTCSSGMIRRKAYTRRLGKKIIRVKSGCIKAQSQSGTKRSSMDRAIIGRKKSAHKKISKIYGTPRCGPGKIVREGYRRKGYTRKSGVKVASSLVAPGCIKAVGISKKMGHKGTQLFVLKKGELVKYGYHANEPEMVRHEALTKALQDIKPLSVYRKLNALYVLNKNKDPQLAQLYRNDADWVKTTTNYVNRSV
jgi:hypothetical protein